MHQQIENKFNEHKYLSHYRNIFERVDFSFIDVMYDLSRNASTYENLTNKHNVGRFFNNILSSILNNVWVITKEQLEEVYNFIVDNPEIRVMNLPFGVINYDNSNRRGYIIKTHSKSRCYDVQRDKLLLYSISIINGELVYRYAIDKNGIVINYEYI